MCSEPSCATATGEGIDTATGDRLDTALPFPC